MKRAMTLVSGLVLTTAIAFAGEESIDKSFKDLDTNRDGAITEVEAAASRTLMAHFKEADTNRDGRLDNAEFLAIEAEVEEAE